jgi:tetratricopeptide (TPR) repeat protein
LLIVYCFFFFFLKHNFSIGEHHYFKSGMSSNQTLESFVNSVRALYQSSTQQQQPQAATSSSNSNRLAPNYAEIYNTVMSNLEVFNENVANLLDYVAPIFTLPEFTLPKMGLLYSIENQLQKLNSSSTACGSSSAVTAIASVITGGLSVAQAAALASINQSRLLEEIENCLELADEKQVEYSADIYTELCHFYTSRLCQMGKAKRGLVVLRLAVRKLQLDPNNENAIRVNLLTSVHADALQLSLAAKNFKIGLELLSHDILDIYKPSNFNFDAKYLLAFFYYAGCIYAALKQHEQALFYFEQALTVPANALSQIMIETYKKFLLVSLINNGKLPSLPKYTSRVVINQVKPNCSLYHDLASAYLKFDMDKLNSLMLKYADVFQQDNNVGLLKQLKNSMYKKNIQKLTKMFITLSLSDMATLVKLGSAKEAEYYVLDMIKDGEIFATINQKDGKPI